MGRIQKLDETVANQIAAGEVIERPASVVKELVENSVDAHARRISIEIAGGGVELIRIVDDGEGMSPDDARLCLERHATSKIRTAHDIERVGTLGFRGEAIPSIASVSRFVLTTRTADAAEATRIEIDGGRVVSVEASGAPTGTSIEVRDLFFNVPARRKFLKRDQTETSHVDEAIERIALAFPDVAVRSIHDGRSVLDAPVESERDPRGRLGRILGAAAAKRLHPIEPTETGGIAVSGFAGAPDLAERTGRGIRCFVNGRFIRDRTISHAVQEAYRSLLTPGRQPVVVLHLKMPPELLDVNAHPQKLEVRFSKPNEVHRAVTTALARTLAKRPWLETQPVPRTYVINPPPSVVASPYVIAPPPSAIASPSNRGPGGAWGKAEPSDRSSVLIDRPVEMDVPSEHPRAAPVEEPRSPHETSAAPSERDQSDAPVRWAGLPPAPRPEPRASIPNEHQQRIAEALAAIGRRRALEDPTAPKDLFDAPTSKGSAYFGSLEPIGQALGRYLICQGNGKLVLVDQKAAHQRVLLARMLADRTSGHIDVQPLLIPIQLELDRRRGAVAEAEQERLSELGFSLEPFGGTTWVLKATPARVGSVASAELITAILDDLAELGTSASLERVTERVFARAASQASVGVGDRLSKDEIRSLLVDLDELAIQREDRGRAISVEWIDRELDKLFVRRVLGP
ncbi:MAG: DNA mismatch repair endonuclease MutL [Deltaproteobacteria bacterium]|nr:DNA mismatch repair endonuclease MutL [Deltaproteobacteria bacterium]